MPHPVSAILAYAYTALTLLILASSVLTWVPKWRWTPPGRVIFRLTEPMLTPIRRYVRPLVLGGIGLDFAPIILLVIATIVTAALIIVARRLGM